MPLSGTRTDQALGVVGMLAVLYLIVVLVSERGSLVGYSIAIGVVLVVAALLQRQRGRRRARPATTAAALKELVRARGIPFSVCTNCRVIIDLPHAFACPECGSSDKCVRVEEEDERSMANAAIGVD